MYAYTLAAAQFSAAGADAGTHMHPLAKKKVEPRTRDHNHVHDELPIGRPRRLHVSE